MSWTRNERSEVAVAGTIKVLTWTHPEGECELILKVTTSNTNDAGAELGSPRFFDYIVTIAELPIIRDRFDLLMAGGKDNTHPIYQLYRDKKLTKEQIDHNASFKCEHRWNTYELIDFLNVFIGHYDLWGSDIHADIFQFYGLRKPVEIIFNELNAHLDKHDVESAITLTKMYDQERKHTDNFFLWQLIEIVEKRVSESPESIDPTFLLTCYQTIESSDEKYQHAQQRIFELLHGMHVAEEKKFDLLKEKIPATIKVGDMWLANQYLNELCGLPIGFEKNFIKVEETKNLDPFDVIFKLAKFMRESRRPEIHAATARQEDVVMTASPSPEPSASASPRFFRETDNQTNEKGESSPSSTFSQ